MTAAISFKDVKKSFGPKLVLDGISLEIHTGQSLAVIGGSGSGKSVLLKTLLGLIPVDSGRIYVNEQEVISHHQSTSRELMKKFGMLFQGGALFDSLTVGENVAFPLLKNKQMKPAEAKEIVIAKLSSVGLGAEILSLYPSELSGGMQKRVALARAIVANPEIILFDEPTTGLDPIMADVINDLIIKCSEELGATTITITHDMHSVRKIADQVAMIYKGKIIWHGGIDTLENSGNPYVDQFIHGRAQGPIQMETQSRTNG